MLQAETEPDDLNDENEVEATAPSLYPDLDGSVSGGSGDYRPTSSVKDDTGSAEIDIPGMEEEEPLLSVESEVEPSTGNKNDHLTITFWTWNPGQNQPLKT